MRVQTEMSKLAEIKYRSLIVKQHLGCPLPFPNEPNASEFTQILRQRLAKTAKAFRSLQKKGVRLSPFLEIGAEYGLSSALLESKFSSSGLALDISLHSLSKAKDFAKKFNLKTPKTICADAYNLPFKSNSFPFVFVYESLHHFPDPLPVLKEIYRVMTPGGVFLIGGDPIAQTFQMKLWRRPTKLRPWEKLLKYTLILLFISHIGKTEVDHGILEETFSLKVWQRALTIFDSVEAKIMTPLGFSETRHLSNSQKQLKPNLPVRLGLFILGGGLQALCFKLPNRKTPPPPKNLLDLLICPNCLANLKREISLKEKGVNFACPTCRVSYKKYQQVPILLEPKLTKLLMN